MERNITLDYFKILLSILVITIHVQPLFYYDTTIGWLISNGIARIAVPCFFIINGYFLGNKISNQKQTLNYIFKLLTLYIVWVFIYLPDSINKSPQMLLISIIGGYIHLWYIMALIIGTIILFVINKQIKNKHILLVVCILLFVTGSYLQTRLGVNSIIDLYKTRNGIFAGLPFIFVGNYIWHMKEKINKINSKLIFILLMCSFIIFISETLICFYHDAGKDLYFSLILLCPLLFISIMKKSVYKINDGYIGLIASGIYFTHILSMNVVNAVFPTAELKIYTLPLVIFLSTVLSAVVIELNKRIKIFL